MPRPHPHFPHLKSHKTEGSSIKPHIICPFSHQRLTLIPSQRSRLSGFNSSPWPLSVSLASLSLGTSFLEGLEFLESTSPELQAHKSVIDHTQVPIGDPQMEFLPQIPATANAGFSPEVPSTLVWKSDLELSYNY